MSIKDRTNIFGTESAPFSDAFPPYTPRPPGESQAAELTNRLTYIAERALDQATDSTTWLATAANAGQNDHDQTLVKRLWTEPLDIRFSDIYTNWGGNPTTVLPALPDSLKVDYAKLAADVQVDISKLKDSWLTQYLPAPTDVSALNSLVTDVLNGTAANSAQSKLDALAADLKSALSGVISTALAALTSALSSVQTNLASNFGSVGTGITAGVAIATDNTQNIAFQNARDQVARETLRNERAVIQKWASRGFSLPGGVLTKQVRESQQRSLDQATEIAAKQAIEIQKLFFDAAKLSVEATMRKMDAQVQADISAYKVTADVNLKYAELQLDANKTNARTAFEHLGLRLDFTKFSATLASQYRLGVINGLNGLISAYAQLASKEVDYANAISGAQQRAYAAITDYFRATITHADWGLKAEIENNEKTIKFANIAAGFIGTAVGHHVQAAMAAADVFSRSAGMALSGLNSVASTTTTQQI